MKVAVFFGGTIRTYKANYESFSNTFLTTPGVDVDVFASINKVNSADLLGFTRLYRPTKTRISHYENSNISCKYDFIDRNVRWNNYNTLSMYYHNQDAMKLIDETGGGNAYDLVVKYRADCIGQEKFPYEFMTRGENMVYIPHGNDYGGYNDQVAAGNTNAMRVYCSLFDKLVNYVKDEGCRFHPETLLRHHLDKHKDHVHVMRFDFGYHLDCQRNSDAVCS